MADPRHPRRGPLRLGRRAGKGNQVERQGHLADHPLHMTRVGHAWHEKSARAGVGERLAALDHLVDQRIIPLLDLEEQVGAGVDEERVAHLTADHLDPMALLIERVHPLAADHLVLEIAADRTGSGQESHVFAGLLGIGRIGAFEIDRQRQLDRLGDPPGIGQREVDRHLLAIGKSVGIGDRMAAGGECLGARRDDRISAADVPDIVEHHRIARHVQRGEGFELRHANSPLGGGLHGLRLPPDQGKLPFAVGGACRCEHGR